MPPVDLPALARVLTLAALVAAPALPMTTLGGQAPDRRPSIAVIDFDNAALVRHADYEPLRLGIAFTLNNVLARNSQLRVVERERIDRIMDELKLNATDKVDKETAVKVGHLLGMNYFVTGGFVIDPKGRVQLSARVVNTETSQLQFVAMIPGKEEDLLDLINQLGDKINNDLHLPEASGRARPSSAPKGMVKNQTDPVKAVGRALASRKAGDLQAAIAACREALAFAPDYPAARDLLASLERQPPGQ
jgi:TolB-like protein